MKNKHEDELQELLVTAGQLIQSGELEDALFVIHNAEQATEALLQMRNTLDGSAKSH